MRAIFGDVLSRLDLRMAPARQAENIRCSNSSGRLHGTGSGGVAHHLIPIPTGGHQAMPLPVDQYLFTNPLVGP